MAKKNPNIFTIGFKKNDTRHQRAVELLNGSDEKAELIATALLCYFDEDGRNPAVNGETGDLRPLIQRMVREEIQKTLQQGEDSTVKDDRNPAYVAKVREDAPGTKNHAAKAKERASVTKKEDEQLLAAPAMDVLDENLRRDITAAMDAFRHT